MQGAQECSSTLSCKWAPSLFAHMQLRLCLTPAAPDAFMGRWIVSA